MKSENYLRIRAEPHSSPALRGMLEAAKLSDRVTHKMPSANRTGMASALQIALIDILAQTNKDALIIPEGCFYYHGAVYCTAKQPITVAPLPVGVSFISKDMYARKETHMSIRRMRKATRHKS